MDITFLGHATFVLKSSQGTVILDPYNPEKMNKPLPKLSADIVTISHHHDDHDSASAIEGNPLVIDIPGEYEKNGIRISGFGTFHDKSKGEERGKNTIYKIEFDDVSVLHCGDLGHMLSSETIEDINGADVVMVPVGGVYTIDADEARQLVEKLEPSIVIPMHYRDDSLKPDISKYSEMATVSDFLQKVGVSDTEPEKKLKLSRATLDEEETRIIVMEAQ